jgi:peptide/nickel transport system permease protein
MGGNAWLRYAVRRIGLFFLIVWAAASLNFFLPRLAPGQDPVRARMGQLAATGAATSGVDEMVKAYQKKFGLDQPLYIQYVRYLGDYARFDFGYSLAQYPARVIDLIARALPWTILLLLVSTILAFIIGTLAGALLGWQRAPGWIGHFFMPILTLSAVPYYLLGLVLVYFFAFKFKILPLSGGYKVGTEPALTLSFTLDAIKHSLLPGLSIVLAQIGFWAIAMRGMMVMTEGEDCMTYAEAKGLPPRTVFFRYGIRNAILPQATALALSLGGIVSQSVLVEVVFGYPGIGTLLFRAIAGFDYFLIYGIVFLVIVSIGLATLVLDLIYPLLDPRITYRRQ